MTIDGLFPAVVGPAVHGLFDLVDTTKDPPEIMVNGSTTATTANRRATILSGWLSIECSADYWYRDDFMVMYSRNEYLKYELGSIQTADCPRVPANEVRYFYFNTTGADPKHHVMPIILPDTDFTITVSIDTLAVAEYCPRDSWHTGVFGFKDIESMREFVSILTATSAIVGSNRPPPWPHIYPPEGSV